MKALKFNLSGKNAFFKKPEVNTYYSFTYGQIHKVVLLGIFGAILGYGGYGQKSEDEFPEFYSRLKELKISIVPKNSKGYIMKKIQSFNNSVGYASKETGGNLIVKEQWLDNPEWQIFVLLDCEEARKVAEQMQNRRCVYMPYLGKNDHPADITNVKMVELKETQEPEITFSSMFPRNTGCLVLPDEDDDVQEYKYEEKLPIRLNAWSNMYEYDTFIFTNLPVRFEQGLIYKEGQDNLSFY